MGVPGDTLPMAPCMMSDFFRHHGGSVATDTFSSMQSVFVVDLSFFFEFMHFHYPSRNDTAVTTLQGTVTRDPLLPAAAPQH